MCKIIRLRYVNCLGYVYLIYTHIHLDISYVYKFYLHKSYKFYIHKINIRVYISKTTKTFYVCVCVYITNKITKRIFDYLP